MAGSFEHSNEPLGTIKVGNFLLVQWLLASQEGCKIGGFLGCCTMESGGWTPTF